MSNFTNPLEVFRVAVAAVNAGDWLRVAACCDLHSLRAFQTQLCERYAPITPRPVLTPELLLQLNPDMPRDVAEYEASQHARRQEKSEERFSSELPGIADAEALRSATPEHAFAAWLQGRSPQRQLEQLMAAGHAPREAVAQLAALAAEMLQLTPLGAVSDGEHIAHVLYRHGVKNPVEPLPPEVEQLPAEERQYAADTWSRLHPEVISARRQPDDTWCLLVEHGFLSLGTMTFAWAPEPESNDELPTTNDVAP